MKLKLDENIGRRGLELLRAAGHDVMTVRDQGLEGATDEHLFATCAGEARTLITLDHDFGQVTRFPPKESAGVVILEARPRASVRALLDRLRDFLAVLETQSLSAPSGSSNLVAFGYTFAITRNELERSISTCSQSSAPSPQTPDRPAPPRSPRCAAASPTCTRGSRSTRTTC